MLIEQNIEFELRRPGPPGRICTLQLVIFTTKQNFSSGLLFAAKILQEAMYFTFSYLGQISYKI